MKKLSKTHILVAAAAAAALLTPAVVLSRQSVAEAETEPGSYVYNELYRDQLSFSPDRGWNNDPNGLIYANGKYHMYYQYNLDSTQNFWGHMSWGHAVSDDLVYWEQKPVALPEGKNGYGMMFSGSVVYDENDTSGFFNGGSGFVAFLTQPDDAAGGQRQIVAYSPDGNSYTVGGEVLGANGEWSKGDGEFRDPKVFWNEQLNKWLMVVGGGSVRMFWSDDLTHWEYKGETGYWGECPDISQYTVEGVTKYALVISPEDKSQSYEYNKNNRKYDYYPAEYYVIGHLDESAEGLFVGETPVTRLTQGIDCYALQTFNNSPDGKVYAVSWSGSWKTVGQYEALRENYNGGMTVACELSVVKNGNSYALARNPVAALTKLRKTGTSDVIEYSGTLAAGANAFADKTATVADLDISLDFSDSDATRAVLSLRSSSAERIDIVYDVTSQQITLDRSKSSLAADGTELYNVAYTAAAPLTNGKLDLRVLLDRGSVSVFAAGGRASLISAVFPSLCSDGLSLTADASMGVEAHVYGMESIFGSHEGRANNNLYVSKSRVDTIIDREERISVSSLAAGFDFADVTIEPVIEEDGDLVLEDYTITRNNADGYFTVKVAWYGHGTIDIIWNGVHKSVELEVYDNYCESNIEFPVHRGGSARYDDEGIRISSGLEDAFLFSDASAVDFSYTVTITPEDEQSQAGAVVFGVSDNYADYYVATVDYAENKLKLWRAGVGDLKVMNVYLKNGEPVVISVEVIAGVARIFLPDLGKQLVYEPEDYTGGKVGLNVYNSTVVFNEIVFEPIGGALNADLFVGEREVMGVVNVSDCNAIVTKNDYTIQNGYLTLTGEYMDSLPGGRTYMFKVFTDRDTLSFTRTCAHAAVTVTGMPAILGAGLVLELDRDVTVNAVTVGETSVSFVQKGKRVTVEPWAITDLSDGEYYVTVYSDSGRAEALVSLRHEYWQGVNTALIACMSVLFGLIIAGAAVLFVFMYKRSKSKEPAPEPEPAESAPAEQ